jgi:DnaJ-class molecular chaperone
MKDPYEVLGVRRDADQATIKKTFRKIAKKKHPDLNPGNKRMEQEFKEVNAAYDLLSDPEKRARFDRGEIDASGAERPDHAFYRSAAGRGRRPQGGEAPFEDARFAEDVIAEIFGGRRAGRGGREIKMRGEDIAYTLSAGFVEAALGGRKRVTLPDGKVLDVTLPPGTEDRQTLRLKGQGGPGIGGGPPGDAYVQVHIEPHPFFTRKDAHVHLDLPVTLPEAVLGANVTVPTIDGKVSMKIPPRSNTGTVLRLKGRGILDRRKGERGDQYVTLKVVLPERPDAELARFLETWSKTHPYDVRSKSGL